MIQDNTQNKIEYEEIGVMEPFNPLDPYVVVEPLYEAHSVATLIDDTNIKANDEMGIKVNGIYVPVINVNNRVMYARDIQKMTIDYTGFTPTISLVVRDLKNNIQVTDVPGMSNIITVVITASIDGVYRKIKLDFYITKCDTWSNNSVVYSGILKNPMLEKNEFRQVGNGQLSTYEMLEAIAKETGMGFAATKGCAEIKDSRYRNIYSMKMRDFIMEQVAFGGIDADSIFDCWVDLYGYIVMANISTVMRYDISPRQLTIYKAVGFTPTTADIPDDKPVLTPRTLTNSLTNPVISNMQIVKYESIVNTERIVDDGALNRYYILQYPGTDNRLQTLETQIIEDSIDGVERSYDYEYEKMEFLGVEMETMPILYQKQLHTKYMTKIRSRQLMVELDKPNFGLERGTLVNVVIYDYDSVHQSKLLQNMDNAFTMTPVTSNEDKECKDNSSITTSQTTGVVNYALSGMYYIDGMKYTYDSTQVRIIQTLFLIKRGLQNNIYNKETINI